MCHTRHAANDYLAEHYNGGKILEDVFTVGFDPTDTGLINFEEVIYEGSYRIWQKALRDPAHYVDWILVKPSNSEDLVAQNVDLQSPVFLSQFTLVFQQTDGVLLYHRIAGLPMSDRPAPTPLNVEHPPCTTVAR
jgi:hypothetical protein